MTMTHSTQNATKTTDPVVALMIAAQDARSTRITHDDVGEVFTAMQLDHADADGQLPRGTVVLIGTDPDALALQNLGGYWSEVGDAQPVTSLIEAFEHDTPFRLVWLADR